MDDWNTCAARPSGSATSPTTSHDRSSRPADSDPTYTLDPDEPQILDGARQRAGLAHATCHELRHTCFTRLREAGMALEAIQAQAGHASIETTRIYLHLSNDWLAGEYHKAMAILDALHEDEEHPAAKERS